MSGRVLTVLTVGFLAIAARPASAHAQFGGVADGDEVTVWVVGSTDGGVKPPKGTSCSRWRQVMGSEMANGTGGGAPDGPVTRKDAKGVTQRLMVRVCGTKKPK